MSGYSYRNNRFDIHFAADYYPYGKTLRYFESAAFEEKFLTTQHERDRETGFDYRGARYYDSDLGRFLSLDPLAAKFPAWSAYNYVLGNPVKYTDPDGKEPEDIIIRGKNNSSMTIKMKMVNLTFDVNHDFRGNFIVNKPLTNPFIDFLQRLEDGMKGNGDRSRFIENGNTLTSSDAKEYDNSGIEAKSEHTIDVDWFTASKGHKSSIPSWGTTTKDIKGVLKIIQHIQKVKKEFNEMIGEDTEEESSSESNESGNKKTVQDTVWRTPTEQWHLYNGDTTIWDIDERGNTRTPKFKTYHNR